MIVCVIPATANVLESLSDIPTTEIEKPQQGNQLKLMSLKELLHSFTVKTTMLCGHMSYVTSDRVWVSVEEKKNIIYC